MLNLFVFFSQMKLISREFVGFTTYFVYWVKNLIRSNPIVRVWICICIFCERCRQPKHAQPFSNLDYPQSDEFNFSKLLGGWISWFVRPHYSREQELLMPIQLLNISGTCCYICLSTTGNRIQMDVNRAWVEHKESDKQRKAFFFFKLPRRIDGSLIRYYGLNDSSGSDDDCHANCRHFTISNNHY